MAESPIKDKNYNLISAVYNNAEGVALLNQFIRDAEQDGDNEAVQYFREVQEQYHQLGEKGRRILKDRL